MTLKDCLDRRDWAGLERELNRLVAPITERPDLREGAVRAVMEKLQDLEIQGDFPELIVPESYLGRALRWRVLDLVRRESRRPPPPPPPPPETEPYIDLDAIQKIERLLERARKRRGSWQREHLDHAWRQLRRLLLENITLKQILIEEGEDPTQVDTFQQAIWRAHTAHRRLRMALLQALKGLDADSAEDLRVLLNLLKRRKTSPPGGRHDT